MKKAAISGGLAMESSTTIVTANSQLVLDSDSAQDWTCVPAKGVTQSQDTAPDPSVSVAAGSDETAREPLTLPFTQVFNADESQRFLGLLGKDPKAAWFRCLRVAPSRGTGKDLHGFSGVTLQDRISKGQNVYLLVGEATTASGKGGGVENPDITACPALFVEWDDGTTIEEQQQRWQSLNLPEPSVMVSTGGKSVHVYWVLKEPISGAEWKRITKRLIAHCNSDANCSNPARVMRLPGSVYYDKKTGKATGHCSILSATERRYSAAEVEACLPVPAPLLKPVKAPLTSNWEPRSIDEINAAAAYIPRRVGGEGTYEGDWHAICGCSAAFMDTGMDRASADAAALELLGHKWPDDTARQALESAKTRNAASFWANASEHGYPLSRSKPAQTTKASGKSEPLTFEQNWELLELHAAELACSTWSVMKAVASMAVKTSELEIPRLGQRQLEQLLEQAQRRIRAKTEPVQGGGVFTIKATPWAVEGIFRHGLNLLTGQSGAGKSRLAAACMAAWLRGDATWLQRKLQGDEPRHRHALIVGTDQNLEDWHLTLGPVGLTTKLSATEVQVHDRLTIYSLETGIQLDADGLNTIRRWVDDHPCGMVLIDSLAQCLPAGVDEDKSSAARPVHQLQEVLGDAWAILTHHTRKGAGKEGNLGVGAGRGSGAIDAAVSRVVGLGLIYRMENGQMVAQESDPRRELLSTKRGGKTEHLIVSSDEHGFWDVHGTAEALKAQERQQRTRSNLTEAQSDVLSAVESADGWTTTRDVVEALGEEYEATSAKAATTRKVLKRLEVLGLVETQRVGTERSYRATEPLNQREVDKKGSIGSVIAAQGFSLAQSMAQQGSAPATEPVEPPEPMVEPVPELGKNVAAQQLSQLSHPPSWAAAALVIREQDPSAAAFTVALRLQTDYGFNVTGRQVQELFNRQETAA